MSEVTIIRGQCLCGDVQFSANMPAKWCAHCHCSMCRRQHGAGYVTWVGFEISQFQLDRGSEHLNWYQSSSPAQRGFCTTCGSSLFFRSERWADEIHIAMGTLTDTLDLVPHAHAFYDTHVDWMAVDPALPIVKPEA